MEDIRKKSDAELAELVQNSRDAVRLERFKDRFSRKAGVIRNGKLEVARALTELTVRRKEKKN